ncbi:hypothetical protein E4M02_11155 [Brevundimonas sp. S30B]|uniref:hypothetical protein n=1 Tax=unclassified Brevundimonas TaxID=2622653 RepID=UPI00107289DC|nr:MULTISPECIES: hypothetical protein [unclassified Brevundimonas]QBX38672.1 hypothetical protein E4M01_13415 [Brevundimonas sp. MF30-B]TFW01263.1 hypothetical protein E4M02_11155 [Brevundimonas sp. S30B]
MGLFSFLFGKPKPPIVAQHTRHSPVRAVSIPRLVGDGSFGFEVVGESHRQEVLSRICGGHCEEGHEKEVEAILRPDPTNPHDGNAVRVEIMGEQVAYLSRADAADHLNELRRLGLAGQPVRCAALINGGWRRERKGGRADEGHFGVELDIIEPLEVEG